MKYIFLDSGIPQTMTTAIAERGYKVILLPPSDVLDTPVCCHPDMLCINLSGRMLMQKDYYETNRSYFHNLPIITTDEPMGKKYPSDILLNALCVGETVYGRKEISNVIKRSRSRHIEVRQGYTRCSTLLLENAAVTADKTIAKALRADGMEILEIVPGNIRLDGYDCGFIGGASAVIEREVLFFGNIDTHPDGKAIKAFIKSKGYEPTSLSDEPLYDHGGAVTLQY